MKPPATARHEEIARRLAAAYISCETGMTPAAVYRQLAEEDIGETWYRVAQLIEAAFRGEVEMPGAADLTIRPKPFRRICHERPPRG